MPANESVERFKRVLDRLSELTVDGRVTWAQEDGDTYVTKLGNAFVYLRFESNKTAPDRMVASLVVDHKELEVIEQDPSDRFNTLASLWSTLDEKANGLSDELDAIERELGLIASRP